MCDVFYLFQYKRARVILAIWKLDVFHFTILLHWEKEDNPPWGMILEDILIYFLLFSLAPAFDFKPSALNLSHIFHRAWNVWKLSPVCYCMNKIFWQILASSLFSQNNIHLVFLKEPMRTGVSTLNKSSGFESKIGKHRCVIKSV